MPVYKKARKLPAKKSTVKATEFTNPPPQKKDHPRDEKVRAAQLAVSARELFKKRNFDPSFK